MKINEIVNAFNYDGKFVGYEPFGMGHINDTFAISFENNNVIERYVLQRMNTNVFKNPEGLMNNVKLVTHFIIDQIESAGGNAERQCLHFLPTVSGSYVYRDEEGLCWRTYKLVEDCEAYQIAVDPKMYGDAGRAFGTFINRLNEFNADSLCEVIPNFHNTVDRLRQFHEALDKDFDNRSLQAKDEIKFFLNRVDYCSVVVDKLASGELPLRVTHNDTKLNNVLIDNETKKAICVIDLDTIMPGSMMYDFGDAIRSGCNTGLEDEADLSKVNFDINLFEHFCEGFLDGVGLNITIAERDLLAFSAILMTFECGMRFLSDFLNGDTYFKTKYPTHNLVRARTQIKLVQDMEKQLDTMKEIVKKHCKL